MSNDQVMALMDQVQRCEWWDVAVAIFARKRGW